MARPRVTRIYRLREAPSGRQPMIRQDEILDQLDHHESGVLFLNTFTEGEIRDAIEASGILAGCRDSGYEDLELFLDASNAFRHVLRIHPTGKADLLLAEFALRVGSFHLPDVVHEPEVMLVAEWVLLQSPEKQFTASRPALPGQKHPGLGMGRAVVDFFLLLARGLRAAGIIEHPEFYHAAVMYSRTFRFLHPAAEGAFLALRRDLAELTFADAAWAVHRGLVREGRRTVRWIPEEQVMPLSEELKAYFSSDRYSAAVAAAREARSFRLVRNYALRLTPTGPAI